MRTCIKNVNQDWKNAVEGATGGNGPPLAFKALEQANTAGRGWRACRVRAQSGAVDSTEVMRQLLSMPAPTPRSAETPTDDQPKKRSPKFFDKDNAPPDSAPLEDLLEYWDRWANSSDRPDPSDSVRKRLPRPSVCHCEP